MGKKLNMKCMYCNTKVDTLHRWVEGKMSGLIPEAYVKDGELVANKGNSKVVCYNCMNHHSEYIANY